MVKNNMFFRTVVASAALAVMGVASAGTVTTATRNVAQEAFGTAVIATTAVAASGVTYTFATPGGIVINPGGTIYVSFTATGGTLGQTAGLSLFVPNNTGANSQLNTSTVALTAGKVIVTLTNSGTANAVLGVGASLSVGTAAAAVNQATNVAAGTGTLVVTNALSLGSGTKVTFSGQAGTGATGTAELEAASAAADLVTSSMAVTAAAVASSSFATPETKKINLTSTPTAGTNLIDAVSAISSVSTLGSITFTDGTVANQLVLTAAAEVPVNTASTTAFDGTTSYDLSLVSGAFTAGTVFSLASTANCGTAVASTQTNTPVSTLVTAATTAVNLSTVIGARPVTAVPVYLCATYPTTAAITPARLTVSGKLGKFSTAYLDKTVAATPLYNLATNGKVVDVRSYVPLSVTGYTSFIRIINSGAVAAQVTSQFINADGTLGASFPLVSLAAAASITMSSTDIQAIMGAPVGGSTARPRLRLSAPTNDLQVQSQLSNNATGVFTDFNGAQ